MTTIPTTFPAMGAMFEKPYMEFEYDGRIYRLGALVGGHNGRTSDPSDPQDPAVQACITSPPSYDSVRGRWIVRVDNNLVHINFAEQRSDALSALDPGSPMRQAVIAPNPDRPSSGLLVSVTTDPDAPPEYPVDSEFSVFLRVTAPGLPVLINREPLHLVATGLEQWPPVVGTEYRNTDGVEFYLDGFENSGYGPVLRILPGDTTVLTQVFTVGE